MKPEKLIVSGWGPYKNRMEIDFTVFDGRGLFLVTGATGAGKTTIFDAITYALYGNLSGQMRDKSSVRSDFADADTPTFVELSMSHARKQYRIIRNPEYVRPRKRGKEGALTREKENAVLYLPDGSVIEGVREVNAAICEILVLDYAQFKQITMIAQGEFARLLTAAPKDKMRIFRDIFGTGIHEQFTQRLRIKAGAFYDKVKEQRHKLEEDIRFLLAEALGERQEALAGLLELTEERYWNYAAIAKELALIERQAKGKEKALQKECDSLQLQNEKLTGEATAKRLENEQIDNLRQAEETLRQLTEQKAEIEEKAYRLKKARAAEALLPLRMNRQADEAALNAYRKKEAGLSAEREKLLVQREELLFYGRKKEELQQYLELCRQLAELKKKEAEEETEYKNACRKWEAAKAVFLEKEGEYEAKKEAYARADKAYRRAVVGIAARMLKAGEPCPVCGSVEHPHPAGIEPGLPSEEEYKRLKEELESAEQALRKEQQNTALLRALKEERKRQLADGRNRVEELAEREEAAGMILKGTAMEREFGGAMLLKQAPYEEKAAYIRAKTERLAQTEGMLTTGEGQLVQAAKDIRIGEQKAGESRKTLQEAFFKEGFATEEECRAADLQKSEMAGLEAEIQAYAEKLSAAGGLKEHLGKTVKSRKKHDLTALLDSLEECRGKLSLEQEKRRHAHFFLEEVKKTKAQYAEKMKKIEAAEEEYGYVKDLENLASGNNAKRLVFEQYVLAGYFEEILRAANLRFFKMTGGRYEMSRVEEAGDGRVKDSLEIQVMDYYTGKQRSVKTLSGGESFKASLSLALGMSDVIQAMNGGIRVDTLFIDEGFGALDSESLDQACEALTNLAKRSRLTGIISHVPELRERIDSQIIVEKTNSGSSVKIHV